MTNPLAFSTLGCPTWNLDQILAAAQEYGYDAVELRGYLDTLDLPLADPFTLQQRAETRTRFADAGIAICCVSSSGVVTQGNSDHVRSHVALAHDLGSPLVRVFGGAVSADLPADAAFARAVENLHTFGDIAQDAGVRIVLETHDSFSTGKSVAALLTATDHPAVQSLWDLHHPYRQGESPENTHRHLSATLAHVHIKDSKPGEGYTLLGKGDIPVFPMLDQILAAGYTGAISLEWEKRWHPDILEPEIAFPQYAWAIRSYIKGS